MNGTQVKYCIVFLAFMESVYAYAHKTEDYTKLKSGLKSMLTYETKPRVTGLWV